MDGGGSGCDMYVRIRHSYLLEYTVLEAWGTIGAGQRRAGGWGVFLQGLRRWPNKF